MQGYISFKGNEYVRIIGNIEEELTVINNEMEKMRTAAISMSGGWEGAAKKVWISNYEKEMENLNDCMHELIVFFTAIDNLIEKLSKTAEKVSSLADSFSMYLV